VIRVLIAEDQTMILGALAALLDIEDDLQVVGRATSGTEALDLVLRERPDVLLTDIEMPGLTGLDLAAELRVRATSAARWTWAHLVTCSRMHRRRSWRRRSGVSRQAAEPSIRRSPRTRGPSRTR
jgi:DNA-binding NarL/FixJ family response regulator